MKIQHLSEILEGLKGKTPRRLVAVNAIDAHTIEAVAEAVKLGIVKGILTGDPEKIARTCSEIDVDINLFTIEAAASEEEAALKAATLVSNGQADLMMKGLISTDKYMRSLLNK